MSQDWTIKIKHRLNKANVRLLVRQHICEPYVSITVWWVVKTILTWRC